MLCPKVLMQQLRVKDSSGIEATTQSRKGHFLAVLPVWKDVAWKITRITRV